MHPLDNDNLKAQIEDLQGLSFSFRQALSILRWLGYGLLLFTFFDWLDVLTPLKFMNPLWEFQTIGALVEKVVIPLLGFVLIFSGGEVNRRRWESSLLKFLSWLTLGIGILYILMIPLGVINTVRINETNSSQVLSQVDKQVAQIKAVQSQLQAVNNESQMQALLQNLQKGGLAITPKPGESLATIKSDLSRFMTGAKQKLENQAKEARSNQQFALFKSSIKWNLGAVIAGVWFIGIWRLSEWARF